LRQRLIERLPAHLVPTLLIGVDKFVLSANGKIDRKALPAADASQMQAEYVAPRTETEQKLAEIWQQLLQVERVGRHDNFFALGGHSLLVLKMLSRSQPWSKRRLVVQDLFANQTLAELALLCDSVAVETGTRTYRHVVPLRIVPGSTRTLVCIHPVGGGYWGYRTLLQCLNFPGDVYGIQSSGHASIEEMAACYVAELKQQNLTTTISLLGWSMGGLVAYDMAQRLENTGHVIMVDSHSSRLTKSVTLHERNLLLLQTIASELFIDYSQVLTSTARLQEMPVATLLEMLLSLAKQQQRLPQEYSLEEFQNQFNILDSNYSALDKYQPTPGEIKLDLIKVSQNQSGSDDLGWSNYSINTVAHEVQGGHFSVMEQPYVQGLAALIDDILNG
ncbi:MAG: hypothetical protein KKF27_12190, partial [Gammaproteobacteria bacterium]|nr:hypothetical protein [Gammaproteobacteria bacterium]MBU2683999.1 hypothetical protein [Gammaproteobacteria bacterium]